MDTPVAIPAFVTHTPALPCHLCGTLTQTSRLHPLDGAKWRMVPGCAEHLERAQQQQQ
jgi:hypothetical protein